MGRKTSDADRLMNYAMNADENALDTAIATLLAIKRNKFPTVVQRAATKRPSRRRPSKVPANLGDNGVQSANAEIGS